MCIILSEMLRYYKLLLFSFKSRRILNQNKMPHLIYGLTMSEEIRYKCDDLDLAIQNKYIRFK